MTLPKPQFAETSLVGDGNPVPLRPDLAATLPEKQQIPADPPPESPSKINPLFVAVPVAAIAFIAAFFFLGGKGRSKRADLDRSDELHDSHGMGKDLHS